MIAVLADAPGCLVRFELHPRKTRDLAGAPPPTDGVDFGALIGDKAFDADGLVAEIAARRVGGLPLKSNKKIQPDLCEVRRKLQRRFEDNFAKFKNSGRLGRVAARRWSASAT